MKKVTYILIYICFVLAISACITCKVTQHAILEEIQFGCGGGFSGAVTTYTLYKDGSLFSPDKKHIKLPCDSLSAIFEIAEQLPKQNFIHPDNTYSFVRIFTSDETYYYAWSWGNLPDKKVIELYLKLNMQL